MSCVLGCVLRLQRDVHTRGSSSMKYLLAGVLLLVTSSAAPAGTKTWDGKYDTEQIEVTIVYFVPGDRKPLPDWRDRVDYFCRRIELFHQREFQGQSVLKTMVHPEPLVSGATTGELRLALVEYQRLAHAHETD